MSNQPQIDWRNVEEHLNSCGENVSTRKLILFACACGRRFWSAIRTKTSYKAIELSEAYADGFCSKQDRDRSRAAQYRAQKRYHEKLQRSGIDTSHLLNQQILPSNPNIELRNACLAHKVVTFIAQCGVQERGFQTIRQSVSNVLLCSDNLEHGISGYDGTFPTHESATQLFWDIFGKPKQLSENHINWQTRSITSLANAIYDKREFEDMPILADALEEAGCTNEDILSHCRSGEPHVRGCWVLDLLLDKK